MKKKRTEEDQKLHHVHGSSIVPGLPYPHLPMNYDTNQLAAAGVLSNGQVMGFPSNPFTAGFFGFGASVASGSAMPPTNPAATYLGNMSANDLYRSQATNQQVQNDMHLQSLLNLNHPAAPQPHPYLSAYSHPNLHLPAGPLAGTSNTVHNHWFGNQATSTHWPFSNSRF